MKRMRLRWMIMVTFALIGFGFDFSKHSIPLSEIHAVGPPKDGIPALFDPEFTSAEEAAFLEPRDRILGFEHNGEAKAYPVKILNWHELVNDDVGGKAVLISYCPLCGSGLAFDTEIQGKRFLFGVSGKLYNSNVLFYDQETESLWSQLKMGAVTGPMTGRRLNLLALQHTTWAAWQRRYPHTRVLSLHTGYQRDYFRDPYRGYEQNKSLYFPVSYDDARLPRKDWVAGIMINSETKAYSFDRLTGEKSPLKDAVGGRKVTIRFDIENRSATFFDEDGKEIPSIQTYWFAWAAFHPDTKLYQGGEAYLSDETS